MVLSTICSALFPSFHHPVPVLFFVSFLTWKISHMVIRVFLAVSYVLSKPNLCCCLLSTHALCEWERGGRDVLLWTLASLSFSLEYWFLSYLISVTTLSHAKSYFSFKQMFLSLQNNIICPVVLHTEYFVMRQIWVFSYLWDIGCIPQVQILHLVSK